RNSEVFHTLELGLFFRRKLYTVDTTHTSQCLYTNVLVTHAEEYLPLVTYRNNSQVGIGKLRLGIRGCRIDSQCLGLSRCCCKNEERKKQERYVTHRRHIDRCT